MSLANLLRECVATDLVTDGIDRLNIQFSRLYFSGYIHFYSYFVPAGRFE